MSNKVTQRSAEVVVQDTGGASKVTQRSAEVVVQDTGGDGRVTQRSAEVVVQDTGGRIEFAAVNIEVMFRAPAYADMMIVYGE